MSSSHPLASSSRGGEGKRARSVGKGVTAARGKSKAGTKREMHVDAPSASERALEAAVFGFAQAAPSSHTDDAPARRKKARTEAVLALAQPAWHDSDDDGEGGGEEAAVAIHTVSRLRKLRRSNDETALSRREYEARLREQFNSQRGARASWADVPRPSHAGAAAGASGDSDEDDAAALGDGLFATTDALTDARVGGIPAGEIAVARVRDLNRADPCRAVVQSISYHPSGSVCAVGALDKRLRFFAPDGKSNTCVASVHLEDMPIASTQWCGGSARDIVLTGRRPFFYVYDVAAGAALKIPRVCGRDERSLETLVHMPSWLLSGGAGGDAGQDGSPGSLLGFLGNDGTLILASARTYTWVANLKMNGSVRAATFAKPAPVGGVDTTGGGVADILSTGSNGTVYRWDVRMMRASAVHTDEGSLGGSAIAASPTGRHYAVGSSSGVVNVYHAADVAAAADTSASSYALAGTVDQTLEVALGAGAASAPRGLFAAAAAAGGVVAGPRPSNVLTQLVTRISSLEYNHDGSLLVAASQQLQDALRVIHTPSGTVYSNWPTAGTPLHFVSSVAFAPDSSYVTIGNDRGRVLMYRVAHYAGAAAAMA